MYFYDIYSNKSINSSKIQCVQYVQFISILISELLLYRIHVYCLVTRDMLYMPIINIE